MSGNEQKNSGLFGWFWNMVDHCRSRWTKPAVDGSEQDQENKEQEEESTEPQKLAETEAAASSEESEQDSEADAQEESAEPQKPAETEAVASSEESKQDSEADAQEEESTEPQKLAETEAVASSEESKQDLEADVQEKALQDASIPTVSSASAKGHVRTASQQEIAEAVGRISASRQEEVSSPLSDADLEGMPDEDQLLPANLTPPPLSNEANVLNRPPLLAQVSEAESTVFHSDPSSRQASGNEIVAPHFIASPHEAAPSSTVETVESESEDEAIPPEPHFIASPHGAAPDNETGSNVFLSPDPSLLSHSLVGLALVSTMAGMSSDHS